MVYFKHLVARKYIFIDILTKRVNLRNLNIKNLVFAKGEYEVCDYAISK